MAVSIHSQEKPMKVLVRSDPDWCHEVQPKGLVESLQVTPWNMAGETNINDDVAICHGQSWEGRILGG